MDLIAHRVNSSKQLKLIPTSAGVEIDIRESGKKITIHHDPFKKGEELLNYIKKFEHKFLIANIKSEGIEEKVIKLLYQFKIKNFFLLDCTFPSIMRFKKKYSKHMCLRISEYENYNKLNELYHHAKWLWIDCFKKLETNKNFYSNLKKKGFKICLVSPELHRRKLRNKRNLKFINKLKKNKYKINMICTKYKNFKLWKD